MVNKTGSNKVHVHQFTYSLAHVRLVSTIALPFFVWC